MSQFQKACEGVARNFLKTSVPKGKKVSEKSIDWISVVTQIGAILIPLFQECKANRNRTPAEQAAFIKQRPFLARQALRGRLIQFLREEQDTLETRFELRRKSNEMLDAMLTQSEDMTEDELVEAIQESIDA